MHATHYCLGLKQGSYKLPHENAKAIVIWFFEDVICRWSCPNKIVTDNSRPWVAVIQWLSDKYGITSIKITFYNLQVNRNFERGHWNLHQSLFKVTSGNSKKWFYFWLHVVWADHLGHHSILPPSITSWSNSTKVCSPYPGCWSQFFILIFLWKLLFSQKGHFLDFL